MRKPLVVANWKMFKTTGEAAAFLDGFLGMMQGLQGVDMAICPPFTCLVEVGRALRQAGSQVALGAQDCFWKDDDAYTAQVSPRMLADPEVGCKYAIIGHSEKRGRLGPRKEVPPPEQLASLADNDETVNAKTKAALAHGLVPVVCVGENAQERDSGRTRAVVEKQLATCLAGLDASQASSLVLAYEPVWAIGAGTPCQPGQAVEVIRDIRALLSRLFGIDSAEKTRILYGGTVKGDNVGGFMEYQDIDGGLVGGASLDPKGFAAIVKTTLETTSKPRR